MALFARIRVLRGFPAAAYREVAFLSRFVCGNRKPLCGLDPNKNSSFMNRKRTVSIYNCGWTLAEGRYGAFTLCWDSNTFALGFVWINMDKFCSI